MEKHPVVITDMNSEYYSLIGLAQPQRESWETVTVEFGCLYVLFYPTDFRDIKYGYDRVVDEDY